MKLIYFVNRTTYLTKMSRVRFHGIRALETVATVKYWGVGWPDYNINNTVQDNLKTLPDTYDMAIFYKPLELIGVKEVTIPKCIRYNEMYDKDWTVQEIQESGCQLVICHHKNDWEDYQALNLPNVTFVYIGHCAEQTIFKNYQLPIKYDILLAGNLSPHYPLRNKFRMILPYLCKKYKCRIHPHPGYDLYDAHTDRYLKEMAIAINQARITLTDTGIPRSRYGKYIEIPMCGSSAICGDLPKDDADDYSYVIEVTNDMSLQEIVNIISDYLDNEDKRIEKVRKGIEFAKNYTQEQYAERLLQTIQEFLKDN